MAFQPVPNGFQCVLTWVATTQFAGMNILNFVKVGPPSAVTYDDLVEVYDAMVVYINDTLTTKYWSTGVEILRAEFKALDVEEAPFYETIWPEGSEGDVASPRLPGNVTKTLTLGTGATGRSRRGRLYVCGIPEDAVTDDAVAESRLSDMVEFWEGLRTFVQGGTASQWAVLTRYDNGVQRPTGLLHPITTISYTNTRVNTKGKRVKAEL